jgi:hypothetical protein
MTLSESGKLIKIIDRIRVKEKHRGQTYTFDKITSFFIETIVSWTNMEMFLIYPRTQKATALAVDKCG